MRLALVGALALVLCGCGGANSPGANTRAMARGTVETLKTVWVDMAKACLSTSDQPTIKSCAVVLDPARGALIAAGDAVNTWDAAALSNFPCLLQTVVADVNDVAGILTQARALDSATAQELADAVALADAFLPQCSSDAGGQ